MLSEKVLFEFRGPFGTPVQIGNSVIMLGFLILMVNGGMAGIVPAAIFFALLMGSIFAHEMGHAWGCHIQGIPVRRVMLFGGGGFCEPARSTNRHQDELIVAMGPIVNLTIWAVGSLAVNHLGYGVLTPIVAQLAFLNLLLAIFNLLPVMPLDGGRLLQLILMRFMAPRSATKLAGGIGLIMCALWVPVLIMGFVLMGFVLFFFPSFKLHLQMWRQ